MTARESLSERISMNLEKWIDEGTTSEIIKELTELLPCLNQLSLLMIFNYHSSE